MVDVFKKINVQELVVCVVLLVDTNFSEEGADSIFRVEGIGANQTTKRNTTERENIFSELKKTWHVKQYLRTKSIVEI